MSHRELKLASIHHASHRSSLNQVYIRTIVIFLLCMSHCVVVRTAFEHFNRKILRLLAYIRNQGYRFSRSVFTCLFSFNIKWSAYQYHFNIVEINLPLKAFKTLNLIVSNF
ncbi:hypothetical protein Plhal304r1_c031g0100381 [Plasmopara halstedii]